MHIPLPDFTIENFRGIRHLHLDGLKKVTLLVGKNGAGKTSVLEAVELWARGMSPSAIASLLGHRAEAAGQTNEPLGALFHAELPAVMMLGATGNTIHLKGRDESMHVGGVDLVFNSVPNWRSINFAPMAPSFFLRSGGLDAFAVDRLWSQHYQQRVDKTVTEALQLAFPEVEDVNVIDQGGARIPVVGLAGLPARVPLARLGDGAWRILGLTLSLVAARSGVLVIDEFENGLHYSIQTGIWRFLLRAASALNVQVFASTHSRDAVYSLAEAAENDDAASVIRLDRKGGSINARIIDQTTLEGVVEQEVEIR